MNSVKIAIVACGCPFSASLVAIYIRSRLPQHHIEGDSRELIKLVMGLIATITALVLGLQISTAYSAYGAQKAELEQLGVHVYEVDRILEHFGPDTLETREVLRGIVTADIKLTWAGDGAGATGPLSSRYRRRLRHSLTQSPVWHPRPSYNDSVRAGHCSFWERSGKLAASWSSKHRTRCPYPF